MPPFRRPAPFAITVAVLACALALSATAKERIPAPVDATGPLVRPVLLVGVPSNEVVPVRQ